MISATEIFCLNELGKRGNNEDCIFPAKGAATLKDRLFVVCDGVGGEKKGEVASQIVCDAIQAYFKKRADKKESDLEATQNSIHHANTQLMAYAESDADAKRMSTTLALVLLSKTSVIAAWCGDSHIHHIRDGKILWKSKDHSLVSELVGQGELTEEEAKRHPRRNVITRSLNALNYNNIPEFHEIMDFRTGDYLLLCTDGFLERVDENVIRHVLHDENGTDKAKLFFSYCDGVTRDNFSMYLVRGTSHTVKDKKPFLSSRIFWVFFILLFLGLLVFFFWMYRSRITF